MSHETSPSTHRPYGIARVTRVWQVPRSTVYAQRNRRARPTPVAKRGPKPPPVGCGADGRGPGRDRRESVPRRRAPQDLGALAGAGAAHVETSDVGRDARCRLARPCAAAHAGRRPSPRRHHRHRQSQRDVGHRCDGHRDAGGRPRHDRRGDRSLHGRMCGTTRGEVRHALRGVGAGAPGRPRSLRDDGRRLWRAGSRCATTTAVST